MGLKNALILEFIYVIDCRMNGKTNPYHFQKDMREPERELSR